MSYYVLNFNPSTDPFSVLVSQIDANVNQYGSGSPIGVRAASRAGIKYFDVASGVEYNCTETDGTIANTTWIQIVYSIADATTTTFGVVQLATQTQVNQGTATNLAVTPATLGALARSGVNADITELTAINVPLSVGQGGTGTNSIAALIIEIFPSFTNQAGFGLSNDGAGNLSWKNFGTTNVKIITATGPLTLYAFHLITQSGIYLTIPSPSNVGDEVALVCTSSGTGSFLQTQAGELIEGQNQVIQLDDVNPLRLVWTGSTNGWWIRT